MSLEGFLGDLGDEGQCGGRPPDRRGGAGSGCSGSDPVVTVSGNKRSVSVDADIVTVKRVRAILNWLSEFPASKATDKEKGKIASERLRVYAVELEGVEARLNELKKAKELLVVGMGREQKLREDNVELKCQVNYLELQLKVRDELVDYFRQECKNEGERSKRMKQKLEGKSGKEESSEAEVPLPPLQKEVPTTSPEEPERAPAGLKQPELLEDCHDSDSESDGDIEEEDPCPVLKPEVDPDYWRMSSADSSSDDDSEVGAGESEDDDDMPTSIVTASPSRNSDSYNLRRTRKMTYKAEAIAAEMKASASLQGRCSRAETSGGSKHMPNLKRPFTRSSVKSDDKPVISPASEEPSQKNVPTCPAPTPTTAVEPGVEDQIEENEMDTTSDEPTTENSLGDPDDNSKIKHDPQQRIQQYKCNLCPKSCSTPEELAKHTSTTHNDQNTFKCDICEKGFRLRHQLNMHKLAHSSSEVRPFASAIRGKTFKRSTHLTGHLRIRSGVRSSFECPFCGRSFTQKFNMIRHQRKLHSGEWKTGFGNGKASGGGAI